MTQDLGVIDATLNPATSTKSIDYQGSKTINTETVAATQRIRKERKNLLGKVAWVEADAKKTIDGVYQAGLDVLVK